MINNKEKIVLKKVSRIGLADETSSNVTYIPSVSDLSNMFNTTQVDNFTLSKAVPTFVYP